MTPHVLAPIVGFSPLETIMHQKRRIGLLGWVAAALVLLGAAGSVEAQPFPARPVRIVVPVPPGGGLDVFVRALSAELSARWGHPVVVENRPGGNTVIGAEAVARSEPDGHTLLATFDQTMVVNRFLIKSLPYDPDRSFAPVTMLVASDLLLVAGTATPASDLKELVAVAKRDPKALRYGSFGDGSQPHLVFETLNRLEGIEMLHVPYKGIAQLLTALAANEVHLSAASSGVTAALINGGRMKALAVAGKERDALFPDVPTTGEQGLPQLQASVWFALFAPAGTPAAIVDRIQADTRAVLQTPAFAEREARAKGWRVVAGTAADLQAAIREQTSITADRVRTAGIQPQ
jgi:tripartite-type tricarboxylate transporter receptor subunit TctC